MGGKRKREVQGGASLVGKVLRKVSGEEGQTHGWTGWGEVGSRKEKHQRVNRIQKRVNRTLRKAGRIQRRAGLDSLGKVEGGSWERVGSKSCPEQDFG